jgi:hypothetical protein
MARIFFNDVQVGVEILTSKIRHENGGFSFIYFMQAVRTTK